MSDNATVGYIESCGPVSVLEFDELREQVTELEKKVAHLTKLLENLLDAAEDIV